MAASIYYFVFSYYYYYLFIIIPILQLSFSARAYTSHHRTPISVWRMESRPKRFVPGAPCIHYIYYIMNCNIFFFIMFDSRRTRYTTTSKCLATTRQNKINNKMKLKWYYFNPSVRKKTQRTIFYT